MTPGRDADATGTHADPNPPTGTYYPHLDAGSTNAFGLDPTPGGWSQPPLLRDDPSGNSPLVQPSSSELPRGGSGRYQILGEIARGGMGVILKGRDPDLGRDLAFKVLKAELAGKPAAEQRFVEEAQVGGQLQHPGVVPVYDLGRFTDGRPYFAMKLVKGRTLADQLSERKDPGQDRGQCLQIFLQVCQTIAYSHAKGVIHRDIKPSNVMVGAFGEVLVMDWGLAKVLPRGGIADEVKANNVSRQRERPEHSPEPTVIHTARAGSGGSSDTLAGSVMGTPAFMPPEQAGGEIDKLDERADVFGLGAVLCVILTGQPPYVAESADALRLMAIRADLEDAFARLGGCGSDPELVTLCRCCLAAKRETRPRHAGEVAGAIATHLAGVEERARKAELERAAAEVRVNEQRKRRRVQAALGLAFTALVILAGAFAWWTLDRKRAQDARIDLALRGAEVLREQATADPDNPVGRWLDAEAALGKADSVLGEGASPDAKARLETLRSAIAVGLKDARDNQALLVQIDQIRNESEGAGVDEVFAAGFKSVGLDADALTPAEFARRLTAKPPAVRAITPATLDYWAMSRRGEMFNDDTRIEKGVRHLLDLSRTVDPDPWRNKLRKALLDRDLIALHELADQADELGKQGPAHLWLLGLGHALCGDNKGAVDVLRPAAQKHPGDYALALELAYAIAYADRTGIHSVNPRSADPKVHLQAEPYVRAAVALRPQSVRPRLALAFALMKQERNEEAEKELQTAIQLAPKDSTPLTNYAYFLANAGREKESLELYRKALTLNPADEIALLAVGKAILDDAGTVEDVISLYRKAAAHNARTGTKHLVGLLWSFGRHDEAANVLKQAIASDPTWRPHRYDLGHLYGHGLRKPDLAAQVFREAIAADPADPQYHVWLGWALTEQSDLPGALAAFEKALELDKAYHVTYAELGHLQTLQNNPEKAIPLFRKAIELRPRDTWTHTQALNVLASLNRLDEAVQDYKKMIARDPRDPYPHVRLGAAFEKQKNTTAAIDAYRDALKIDPKYPEARYALAKVLWTTKQHDRCVQFCRECLDLTPKDANLSMILASVLMDMGKTDEAVAISLSALKANPKDHVARHGVSRILTRAGRWDLAAEALEQQTRLEPNVAVLFLQLGQLREKLGQLDRAAAAYRRAITLNPNYYPNLFYSALVLNKLGRFEEAANTLSEMALRDPTSQGGFYACVAFRSIQDRRGYETERKKLLDRHGKGSDFTAIDHTVKVWLLDPNVASELPALTALAERAVIEGKQSPYYRSFQGYVELTRGLAALRIGEWAKAIEWCDAAPGHTTESNHLRTACEAACRAIKAIALHRQGGADRQATARRELAAAETILRENLENPEMYRQKVNFLFARILADEAAALLGVTSVELAPMPRPVTR